MPPASDGVAVSTAVSTAAAAPAGKREEFTVVCRLDKGLADAEHVNKVVAVVGRAHQMTRLASRLLNFHVRKCLERSLPLPRFGHEHWVRAAWYAVTAVRRQAVNRQEDAELLRTRNEFMSDLVPVDATGLADSIDFEAGRWAATASTNIYRHFPARVRSYVCTEHKLGEEAFLALSKAEKLARKTALAKVAKDLCSDPALALTCPAEFHAFVATTRTAWRLHAFPWAMFPGMPLAYHQAANDRHKPDKCNAHLLLPAMHQMLLAREQRGQRTFALLPLRTGLVPAHTHFGERMLRSVLGLGQSEARKKQESERGKRRKLAKEAAAAAAQADDSDDDADFLLPPLAGGMDTTVTVGEASSSSSAPPAPPTAKRKTPERRPKAQVAAERRAELASLFDLKAAGVHNCKKPGREKEFECTFTSDGYAMHLHFSRPKPEALGENAFPRRGVFDIQDLANRLEREGATEEEHKERRNDINATKAPVEKLQKLCLCCDRPFRSPFPDFICVGCDPGKNEPAVMADPLTRRSLRMTAAGRRHHTQPGNWGKPPRPPPSYKTKEGLPRPERADERARREAVERKRVATLERHRRQAERKGLALEMAQIERLAAAYRHDFVDKPTAINALELELGQLGCAKAATLAGFGAYVTALKNREPTLVPHYEQLHQRRLRFKGHIERQRFVDRFIRDIRRTFDPEHTGKTIIICWGTWGKIAGRPGGVGNKGHPPTIGVGLVKRLAKEDGIVIAWTPEHHTTKTHHKCGGICERFTAAEKRRAKDHGFQHAKEIRGLKRCSCCGDPVNRDLNAALNIGANGILLLTGHDPIAKHSSEEIELLTIENDMQGA